MWSDAMEGEGGLLECVDQLIGKALRHWGEERGEKEKGRKGDKERR